MGAWRTLDEMTVGLDQMMVGLDEMLAAGVKAQNTLTQFEREMDGSTQEELAASCAQAVSYAKEALRSRQEVLEAMQPFVGNVRQMMVEAMRPLVGTFGNGRRLCKNSRLCKSRGFARAFWWLWASP